MYPELTLYKVYVPQIFEYIYYIKMGEEIFILEGFKHHPNQDKQLLNGEVAKYIKTEENGTSKK